SFQIDRQAQRNLLLGICPAAMGPWRRDGNEFRGRTEDVREDGCERWRRPRLPAGPRASERRPSPRLLHLERRVDPDRPRDVEVVRRRLDHRLVDLAELLGASIALYPHGRRESALT